MKKISEMTALEKKELWSNIRMILILCCYAAPFVFLIIMAASYFF